MDEYDRHLDLSRLVRDLTQQSRRHYHLKNEEAGEISRSDTSTGRQMIWDVVVSIAEDSLHEDRCDASTIVRLRGEVDDCDDSSDKDVQRRASDTSCDSDVYWKAYGILDCTS
jgi:hypothetical protein